MNNKTRHVLRLSDFPEGEQHLVKLCDGLQTQEDAQAIKNSMSTLFMYPRMSAAFLTVVAWVNEPYRLWQYRQYRKQLAIQRSQQES